MLLQWEHTYKHQWNFKRHVKYLHHPYCFWSFTFLPLSLSHSLLKDDNGYEALSLRISWGIPQSALVVRVLYGPVSQLYQTHTHILAIKEKFTKFLKIRRTVDIFLISIRHPIKFDWRSDNSLQIKFTSTPSPLHHMNISSHYKQMQYDKKFSIAKESKMKTFFVTSFFDLNFDDLEEKSYPYDFHICINKWRKLYQLSIILQFKCITTLTNFQDNWRLISVVIWIATTISLVNWYVISSTSSFIK